MSDVSDLTEEEQNNTKTDETLENEETENTETSDVDTEETEEEVEIELVVEDGTCVSGANSYVSLEEAILYQTARNRTEWLSLSENEQKASLVKATQYVDNTYNWKGREFRPMNQDLQFPRVALVYKGTVIDGIPLRLRQAVMEASFYSLQYELFTVYHSDNGGVIKREKNVEKNLSEVEGAVKKEDETETEYEYFSNTENEADYISKFAALDSILKGLYNPRNKNSVNAVANWRY